MYVVVLLCRIFGKKTIVTLHGKYVKGLQKPWALIKRSIHRATVPIVLNKDSYLTCIAINKNTRLIPAFIPPQREENLDPKIIRIVDDIHNQGKKVVVTYGFDNIYDTSGREIYGINFLIKYFEKNNSYSLIVSDPGGHYKKNHKEVSDNIFFIDYPHSLYELMRISDVFARNTSKDGDSLSVKEALYLDKKTICSDVVERPVGAYLFKYSDEDSFRLCLESDNQTTSKKVESGEELIVDLYRNLI